MVRHIISWGEAAEFDVGNGLYLKVKDGTQVSSFAYGGSLLGNVTRYRYTRRIRATMETEREDRPFLWRPADGGGLPTLHQYARGATLIMVGSFELAAVLAVLLT